MYSGNLIEIQNNTGVALSFAGVSYAAGVYAPMSKIVTYEVQYSKLWGSDTGRSMTGENKGTLVGIFPKLILVVGKMSDDDRSAFLALVNQAATNIKYYDTEKKQQVTMSFYFNDADDKLLSRKHMIHEGMEIHAVANTKRS